MFCPLKFNGAIQIFAGMGDSPENKEHFAKGLQCDKKNCAWWSTIKLNGNLNAYDYGCALKILAEKQE